MAGFVLPLLLCLGLHNVPHSRRGTAVRRAVAPEQELTTPIQEVARERLEARLFQSPAEALLASPTLQKGAAVLLDILQKEAGQTELEAFVNRTIVQLEAGEADLPALLPEVQLWEAGGYNVTHKEAIERLAGCQRLLDIGLSTEEVIEVESRSGFTIVGRSAGKDVEVVLERRDARSAWGLYSPYAVVEGPSHLLGKRVVEVNASTSIDSPASNPFTGLKSGDKLFLADPDRAAVKEVAVHDHMPEMSRWLTPLVEVIDDEDKDTEAIIVIDGQVVPLSELSLEEDLQEAVRFSQLLGFVEDEAERTRARLHRLSGFPAVKELLDKLAREDSEDAEWKELVEALRPRTSALYAAAREALLQRRSLTRADEGRVEVRQTIPLGAVFVLLALILLLLGALAFCVSGGEPRPDSSQDTLPLYSLQGRGESRVVPLLYGTPFMPSE